MLHFGVWAKSNYFTETEVVYRPPLGPPKRVSFANIQALKRARVLVAYILRAVPRPGVIVALADGTTETWPLDFEGPDEILPRLSALAGKEIQ